MLQPVSHYFPPEDRDDLAYCGHRRADDERGSGAPTCPTCADTLDAEDRFDDEVAQMPMPLDAEEAEAALLVRALDRVYAAMGGRR